MLRFACIAISLLANGAASAQVRIPAMGSAERRAIMDDLRASRQTPDQIFVVETLKIANGWAFAVTKPQTRDSRQRFETEQLVLQRRSGRWRIVDAVCTEDDLRNRTTCDMAKAVARVRTTNPLVPDAIFH